MENMAGDYLLLGLVEFLVMKKAVLLTLIIAACSPNPSSQINRVESAGANEKEKLPPPIKLGNIISFKCDGLSTEENAYKIVKIEGRWVHLQELKYGFSPVGRVAAQAIGMELKYKDVGWFSVDRMNNIIAVDNDPELSSGAATKTHSWDKPTGMQRSDYGRQRDGLGDSPPRGVYVPADNPGSISALVSPRDPGKTCIVVMRPRGEWGIVDWNIVLNGRQYDSIEAHSYRILEINPGKYDMTCGAMGVGTRIYFTAYPGTTLFITAEWERFMVLPIDEGEALYRSMRK